MNQGHSVYIDNILDDILLPSGKPVNEALRYDTDKVQLELIPPEWDWALGQVLTKGAKKYAPRNWEKGMKWSRMVGSLKRHLNAFQVGETFDKETGCHHLAMAAWGCLALMSYDVNKVGENDLNWSDHRDDTQLEMFDVLDERGKV